MIGDAVPWEPRAEPVRRPSPLVRLRGRAELVAGLAQTWWRRPVTPTRVVLDLTRRCNLRCAMCRTWEAPRRSELTPAEIGGVLARMSELRWLDLTGGEIFVRSDLDDVLRAVLGATPAVRRLHFQTNGWWCDRVAAGIATIRALRPEIEPVVTVSIDGPAALHDRIRGRAGAFDRAVATARTLLATPGVELHVGTTVTQANVDALAATWAAVRAALPELPRPRWHWNAMQISQHFYGNAGQTEQRACTSAALREHVRARGLPRSLVEVMESAYLVNLAAFEGGEPSRIPCQALRSTLFLAPEGDVYPCHLYDRPLGNVRERDVLEIWNDAGTVAARRDIEALACGGCFSACEAYPALAGSPLRAIVHTARRMLALARARGDGAG
jgi:radical SAM protein with 4Fe4S-binding SPASM domain